MTIKAGDKMPAGTFKTKTKDGIQDLTTDQLFKGKTVVLFSVPGAFTPTCDAKHLPGYVQQAGAIKAKGVDTGIDLPALLETSQWLQGALEHPVPGMVVKAGLFPTM